MILGHLLLAVAALSVLAPLLLVLLTSLKPPTEIYSTSLLPQNPTLENYRDVFDEMAFGRYLWNSVATTVLRVAGQIAVAILAAYAFARFRFPFRGTLFALVIVAMMIPQQLISLPIYFLVNGLGWFDSWTGLIVPNLAMPLAVFLLRQHMLSFPPEIFDAAAMDGAGELRILRSILLPNLKPVLAALLVMLFVDCWNEYFWPLVISETDATTTVQIGIRRFLDTDQGDRLGPLMAGVTLASLPALAVFLIFQRWIIQTFVSTGVKG
jgi:multiple sugar transport system permease protein/sn-glycerol 3-phosphate transport system permease protein